MAVDVPDDALFAVLRGKGGQPQALIGTAVRLLDGLAQEVHGRPGEEHGRIVLGGGLQGLPIAGEVRHGRPGAPLRARAHIEEVPPGDIRPAAGEDGLHSDAAV